MSQPSTEERRKFVFVFTGAPALADGTSCVNGMIGFAKRVLGWQVLESHCVPLDTPVQVGGVVNSQSDKTK